MDFCHPLDVLRAWVAEACPEKRRLFDKIPEKHRMRFIQNALPVWQSKLTPKERASLDDMLSKWSLVASYQWPPVSAETMSRRAREKAHAAISAGKFHPEGSPCEDAETQKLIAEGDAILQKEAIREVQQEIAAYAKKYSEDEAAIEVASRSDWKKCGMLKRNNILPQSLLDKVAALVEKRKNAIRIFDAARHLGADPSDFQRWANSGKIKTLGYRKGMDGLVTLLDRSALPTHEEIRQLADAEAHLPESERAFGYWAQCSLLKRGWKKEEIMRHLGPPDEQKENPHWKAGPSMQLYLKSRVLRAEEDGLAPAKPKDHVR